MGRPLRAAQDGLTRALLIDALVEALARNPHLRVCQLIVNATGHPDPFYVEDDALIHALDRYGRLTGSREEDE